MAYKTQDIGGITKYFDAKYLCIKTDQKKYDSDNWAKKKKVLLFINDNILPVNEGISLFTSLKHPYSTDNTPVLARREIPHNYPSCQ